MAFTVTATESGASASHGVALLVRVLTNATEAGGASGGAASTGVTSQGSLTPNFSGSYIAFSISADNVSAGMPAAATNNTYDLNTGNGSNVWSTAQGHYTGTVTASTPLTYGAGSAGTSDHSNWCAYEIPASGGTITLDGSSPTGVLSGAGLATGTAATTASFTPPVGSVLVAEVCAGGTGAGAGITMSITDTSGLGMVWTRRAVSSTSDNFQPTWVYTTTVPATFTGISTTGLPAIPGLTWRQNFRYPQHQPEVAAVPPPPVFPPQQYAQPGLAWKQNFHLPQRPKQVPGVLPPYIAGLAGGGSGYFVDQNGKPRLYFATVPWGMPANAGRWNGGDWASDFDQYFADIKAQGMTAAECHPWGHSHTGCNNDLGNTWDGVSPWTTLPTLNNTFWTRIDGLLNTALNHGITVFLVLNMQCDMGVDAFAGTGVFNGVSAANVQAACQNIAARYVNQPNLIFFQGDDYNNDDDTRMQAMVNGLHAGGYTGPTGTEEYSSGTTSRRDLSASPTGTPFTFGGANSTFNWCYYYNVTYFAVEQAYKENNQIPIMWGDGFYVGGGSTQAADLQLMRNFVWWALASGARGVSMGSEFIHPWPSNVFTAAGDGITTNAWYNTSAKAVYTAFTGLTGWQNLLPDLTSTLVTAGRGTRAVYTSATFLGANLGSDNYVAASITPDHSLAVIYCAVAMSITIDQTQLGAGYTATWIDPASGATQTTTTGTTYNSTGLGNNSAGNADWVLALQGPPVATTTSATATIAGAASVTANVTQACTASLAGAGSVTAVATVIAPATVAGAGTVTDVVAQAVTASAAGAGTVTALVTEDAGTATSLAGAGAVNASAVVTSPPVPQYAYPGQAWLRLFRHRQATASPPPPAAQAGTATLAGDAEIATAVTQDAGTSTALAGAGTVTAAVTQACTAAIAGAGTVSAVATVIAPASLAGTGAVASPPVTQAVTATAAGAGSVTDVVTLICTATITGAGAVTANVAGGGSTANPAGAGAINALATQAVTAASAGAGQVTALVTQIAPATIAGAGSVNASGAITGTASLAGAGHVSAAAAQAAAGTAAAAGTLTALATQTATATLAGAGVISATASARQAVTAAQGTPTVTQAVTGTAAVTDPRDGTDTVTARVTSTATVS